MHSPLPERIARLEELSHNLWWSWSPESRSLFRSISVRLWRATDHNPVRMLHDVTPDRLERLAADPNFLKHYDKLLKIFDRACSAGVLADTQKRNTATHKGDTGGTPALHTPTIAYFSAEYGLHGSLPIYSGGLGILSGDQAKTASDMGLDFTAVGFMYPKGYFNQEISPDGDQIAHYDELDLPNVAIERVKDKRLSTGEPLLVSLPMQRPEDLLHLQVWLVRCGRVKIYLMDSNIEANDPANRDITTRLYGGDREYRLRQEIALGIGGVHVLRALGLQPDVFHANEGHVAFTFIERLREAMKAGLSLEDAKAAVRKSSVFTTHTPVPAGHDAFSMELIEKYFWHFWPEIGMTKEEFFALGEHQGMFNMTALSMNLSAHRNAVSKKHREVTAAMWPEFVQDPLLKKEGAGGGIGEADQPLPNPLLLKEGKLTSITNGIHIPTWLTPEMEALFDHELGHDWKDHLDDENYWDAVRKISDDHFWRVRQQLKTSLFSFITDRVRRKWQNPLLFKEGAGGGYAQGQPPPRIAGDAPRLEKAGELFIPAGLLLDPSILTIGFARRFATYKRATLIFNNLDRLKALVTDPLRPIQIIFSGKAHPADEGGKQLIKEIWHYALDPAFGGRIAFIENYGMHVAKYLVRGCDLWMNNPKAPLEASGTSGMKAAINGIPNFSVLDGWWSEGFVAQTSGCDSGPGSQTEVCATNGWGFEGATTGSQEEQDRSDAARMYDILEHEIVPLFYTKGIDGIPHQWLAVAKESIATILPNFSGERMMREYVEKMYRPAAESHAGLKPIAGR
ncbi:MAG TPA: alpha-glucan family phosphorylase [Candidatus Kapabacteria bacterium]|nr:alpha-glucan family phosphorylase [Candidatus Kapabacteria bacterium]